MQTRFVVYRAYNRDGYAPAILVVIAGKHIPFVTLDAGDLAMYRRWTAHDWLERPYIPWPSVAYWKAYARRTGAIRFERFTVLGETP